MNNVERLKQFITNNKLEFNNGSGGDVNILALCGYACYIEALELDCLKAADSEDSDVNSEITRVYNYAHKHHYDKFWKTDKARKQYSF
jgi:hypothetical protein